jgi:hypothetical protein
MQFPYPPLMSGDVNTDISNIYSYLDDIADHFASYEPTTQIETDVVSSMESTLGRAWPDGSNTTIDYYFKLPANYSGGAITLHLFRRGATTGTAVMTWVASRIRDNAAFLTLVSSTSIDFVATDTDTHLTVLTVPETSLVAGDLVRISVSRDGTDGSDTLAGGVVRDGLTVLYNVKIRLI